MHQHIPLSVSFPDHNHNPVRGSTHNSSIGGSYELWFAAKVPPHELYSFNLIFYFCTARERDRAIYLARLHLYLPLPSFEERNNLGGEREGRKGRKGFECRKESSTLFPVPPFSLCLFFLSLRTEKSKTPSFHIFFSQDDLPKQKLFPGNIN